MLFNMPPRVFFRALRRSLGCALRSRLRRFNLAISCISGDYVEKLIPNELLWIATYIGRVRFNELWYRDGLSRREIEKLYQQQLEKYITKNNTDGCTG